MRGQAGRNLFQAGARVASWRWACPAQISRGGTQLERLRDDRAERRGEVPAHCGAQHGHQQRAPVPLPETSQPCMRECGCRDFLAPKAASDASTLTRLRRRKHYPHCGASVRIEGAVRTGGLQDVWRGGSASRSSAVAAGSGVGPRDLSGPGRAPRGVNEARSGGQTAGSDRLERGRGPEAERPGYPEPVPHVRRLAPLVTRDSTS